MIRPHRMASGQIPKTDSKRFNTACPRPPLHQEREGVYTSHPRYIIIIFAVMINDFGDYTVIVMILMNRLFQRVSCESGYSSASPTLGLTGNMQLSNRSRPIGNIQ